MRPQRGPLTFGDQSQVLTGRSNGASVSVLAERFGTSQSVIELSRSPGEFT